jgi:hypothetical protein
MINLPLLGAPATDAQMRQSLRFKKRLAFSLLYRTDVRWKRFQENNISIGDRPDGITM